MSNYQRNHDKRSKSRTEGAAMLVVLMILMIATATAAMSVQSTSFDMRSAGYGRREAQTKYVSEAALTTGLNAVESAGPRSILYAINGSEPPTMSTFNEPNLETGKGGYRILSTDYSSLTAPSAPPVVGGDLGTLGPGQAYDPWFAVDIYDHYTVPAAVAGYRADGNGSFAFLNATFMARGFTVPSGAGSPQNSGSANQAASTTCGGVQSGPFMAQ